jgi:circadian clock protein KaiB
MAQRKPKNSVPKQPAQGGQESPPILLCLFISGMTPRSVEALAVVRATCEQHFAGRYALEVVDIYQQPERAHAEGVIAAPMLIKQRPPPRRKIIGNLTDPADLLTRLELE